VVPSRGSKLIGGSIRTELTRAEVTTFILDGFFPKVEAAARPAVRTRAGLTQLGLPYAQDAAITRHLAAFLGRQLGATNRGVPGFAGARMPLFLHPTAVLFNGGVFKSALLAQRVMETLNDWLYLEGAERRRMLGGADLDLAVARGAAYYSYVRRGAACASAAARPRSYYVAVESSMPAIPGMEPPIQALCVAPFGMEEGSERTAGPGVRPGGRRAGALPLLRFVHPPPGPHRHRARLLGPGRTAGTRTRSRPTLSPEGRQPGDVVQVRCTRTPPRRARWNCRGGGTDGQRWKVEFDVRGTAEAAMTPYRQHRSRHHQHGAGLCGAGRRRRPMQLFDIEQLAPGEVARRALLPSLRYHPAEGELAPGELQLPWLQKDVAGVEPVHRRPAGAHAGRPGPGRLVASAKSWLSHRRRPHGAHPAVGRG
jgi:hypothetical protein